VVYSHQLRRR